MRALAVVAIVLLAVPLAVPAGAAQSQSLTQHLANLHFPDVEITVAPDRIRIDAIRASLAGTTASDLRHCIDGHQACPDAQLAAWGQGNRNGAVEEAEVRGFEGLLLSILNLPGGPGAEFRRGLAPLVTIDGQPAQAQDVSFRNVRIDNAEGPVTSTQLVYFTIRVEIAFPDVRPGSSHDVTIARGEAGFDLADRIVIQPAPGWKVPRDSIAPASLRAQYQDGQIRGSQGQLEGTEPMQFSLERDGGGRGLWWFLAALAIAGGLVAFLVIRRRNRA